MRPDATVDVALPDDLSLCNAMICELVEQLHSQKIELAGAQHRLDLLLRRMYGPKSERVNPDQLLLFAELNESATIATPSESEAVEPSSSKPTRKGHGRRQLPKDLPREQVVHDLSDAEKICPCCHEPRTLIGRQTSEQLDYRPARLLVREHVQLSYACPNCLKTAIDPVPADQPEPPPLIVTAPKPPQPIDKGLAGPGLIAHVITSKYADHLPLHRQEAMLARQGVELSRSTLCDWMASASELLTPLYTWMLRHVLKSRVVQTDETRVPVQDQPGKTKSGRLWVYVGDRNHPLTVYDYRPDKTSAGPMEILKDYQGHLQADAASVFDVLYARKSITEVACWAHARRHFHDARTNDAAPSAEALARIGAFYGVEKQITERIAKEKLDGDAADALRLKLRQELTQPKLDAFATWLEGKSHDALPKSSLGQAIAYARRHWNALTQFTEHGYLNIDNNASERALRAVAVGRKNWLFAGSDAGGRTAAVLYTMTQSCKRHGIDPFEYLRDVLTQLPTLPASELHTLAPHTWAAHRRAEAATAN